MIGRRLAFHPRSVAIAAGLLSLLMIPAVLLAQDAAAPAAAPAEGASPTTQSYAQMFLISDDLIGTAIIWLLVLLSMASMGYAMYLLTQYRRASLIPDETRDELEALIAEKKYREAIRTAEEDPSYLGRVTHAALTEASNGYQAMERAIEEAGDAEAARILRPIEYLNVLGNIAPMIGLFGTVYGMILAFQGLVSSGGSPDPVELAGGISTALVTTFWGLVVAIPALAAYALIRNKIDALTSEGLLVAEDVISAFKPAANPPAATAPAPRRNPNRSCEL